ncbi:hypothetical protein [Sandarakinorhabdus sp. DWP1-3-1]|uniref:hypothetical protein n=1 Tax=Sandarakinorhabdus sp. DWP1-3-1 TaxID=2804627 RepID=UPI003CF1402F
MADRDPFITRVKYRLGPLLDIPQVNALRGVPMPDIMAEDAQKAISRMIVEGGRMVARVGETEGRAAAWYLNQRLGRADSAHYQPLNRERLKLLAGYFPTTDESIDELSALYVKCIAGIDLYAAWTAHDRLLCPPAAAKCRLIDLNPFFSTNRWTLAWAGKRVTIVSPFKTTIAQQWERRNELFATPLLGECDLKIVQAPQTQCEADTSGQSWFDNLDRLDRMVADTDPEVVVIGAGAYGLPIGFRAKARGATAIVLGGVTQLLFGIMGNRWETNSAFRSLITPAWTRPGPEERPPGYQNFEISGGAYW